MKKFFIIAAVIVASVFCVMKTTEPIVNNNSSDLLLENVELFAEGEGGLHWNVYLLCIHGRHENGNGCWCYGPHPTYLEHTW